MNEAVFISDLHLNPQQPEIFNKFKDFVRWATTHTKSVYILGDFLHVWPGDDGMDDWSETIIALLAQLHAQGVQVYFMPGNRDFLLGSKFLRKTKMLPLDEPAVITLGEQRVLLVHGDRYCTRDKPHQLFRKLTRNLYFKHWFLRLPYALRSKLVNHVREHSQSNRRKPLENMQIVVNDMLADMRQHKTWTIIHGHIHKPEFITHQHGDQRFHQYVLSDWDENPTILCYNMSNYVFSNFLEE
jgi:UDP-2,3-diacylglucosamine hydrolase